MLSKNKSKLENISHFITGFIALLTAFDNYGLQNPSYIIFAVLGLIVISLTIFKNKLSEKIPWIDSTFIFIDGIISLIIAVDYFLHGKKALPFTILFAGIMQISVGFYKLKKKIAVEK